MELHLGKMTNKELAEWFGLKPSSMTRLKKQKLEELKNYAMFEEVYGGVEITAIIKDTYNKKDNQIREIYSKGFEELKMPIDTVSHINRQIYEKYNEQLPTLSSAESGYHYAIEVRNANYGVPFKGKGSKGFCYYMWCKMEERDGKQFFIQFTEEEERVKKELLKKFSTIQKIKDADIEELIQIKGITEELAEKLKKEL